MRKHLPLAALAALGLGTMLILPGQPGQPARQDSAAGTPATGATPSLPSPAPAAATLAPALAGIVQDNPGHGFSASFSDAGVTVAAAEAQVRLAFTGYGFANAITPVVSAAPVEHDGFLEYRRDEIVEWYVNDERGLEQGFTLLCPPERGDAMSELVLEVASEGLKPRLAAAGRIAFADAQGRDRLSYDELYAVDANGDRLPARMELSGTLIRLCVDERRAVYPVTIDPTIATTGVSPVMEYVARQTDGSYVAHFGWKNRVGVDVEIPVGSRNRFSPGLADRGQPTSFPWNASTDGRAYDVFSVPFGSAAPGSNLVWSLDGRTSTASVPAAGISPVLEYIEDLGSGYLLAHWGYLNRNPQTIDVPVGSVNRYSPSPIDRGQTTHFLPGRQVDVFTTVFVDHPLVADRLVWTLLGRTATAGDGAPRRSPQPAALKISPVFEQGPSFRNDDGLTYTALFGYLNRNAFPVVIPVGSSNRLTGASSGVPVDLFLAGRQVAQFQATAPLGRNIVWTLKSPNGQIGTATAAAPPLALTAVASRD